MQCVDKVGHSRQSTRKMRTHAHSRRAGGGKIQFDTGDWRAGLGSESVSMN